MEGSKMREGISKTCLSISLIITTSLLSFGNVWAQCSAQELQMIQSYVQLSVQAAMRADFQQVAQIDQQLRSEISPSCLTQLMQLQQHQNYSGGAGGYSAPPSSIYDHGGGTYSYGGVTCGPSGCY